MASTIQIVIAHDPKVEPVLSAILSILLIVTIFLTVQNVSVAL